MFWASLNPGLRSNPEEKCLNSYPVLALVSKQIKKMVQSRSTVRYSPKQVFKVRYSPNNMRPKALNPKPLSPESRLGILVLNLQEDPSCGASLTAFALQGLDLLSGFTLSQLGHRV